MITVSIMKELNYSEVLIAFVLTELSCSYYEQVIHTFQSSQESCQWRGFRPLFEKYCQGFSHPWFHVRSVDRSQILL